MTPSADQLQPSAPLGYAGPGVRPPLPPARHTRLYRIALLCWLGPLVAGLTVFVASEAVRATSPPHTIFIAVHGGPPASGAFDVLIKLGLLDIAAGTVLAAIGGLALLMFVLQRWPAAVDLRRQVIAPTIGAAALLASNFVVALIVIRLAMR